MTVPAQVGAAFEVAQAEAVLELAVVLLDPPPDLRQADEFCDGLIGRQGGQPVIGGLIGFGWPSVSSPRTYSSPAAR